MRHVALVLLLASSAVAQPGVPATAAGRVFDAWLAAVNSGDAARLREFDRTFRRDGGQPAPPPEAIVDFRARTGGFTLICIEKQDPTTIVALLQERESDTIARVEMSVTADDSPTIVNTSLRAIPRPDDLAIGRLSEAEAIAALGRRIDELVAADRFSGVIVVARHGKVLFERAAGLANREANARVTNETRFRMGSMNKMFTAIATLQLVEAGKLSLDDRIGKHLTDYPNQNVATKVTIRHLLTHTGGTGDIFGPDFTKHRLTLRAHGDYVKLYGARDLTHEPGAQVRYSNYGFVLLGAIIERVTGTTYYDAVRKGVFLRAGMTGTDSLPESESVPQRSVGYMRRDDRWVSNADTLPWRGTAAGGGYTTAGDLLRFAQALEAGTLVSRKMLAEATTAQRDGYGYGFTTRGTGALRWYGHGGGAPGMNGELRVYPELGYAIVGLSNLDPPTASRPIDFFTLRMPVPATTSDAQQPPAASQSARSSGIPQPFGEGDTATQEPSRFEGEQRASISNSAPRFGGPERLRRSGSHGHTRGERDAAVQERSRLEGEQAGSISRSASRFGSAEWLPRSVSHGHSAGQGNNALHEPSGLDGEQPVSISQSAPRLDSAERLLHTHRNERRSPSALPSPWSRAASRSTRAARASSPYAQSVSRHTQAGVNPAPSQAPPTGGSTNASQPVQAGPARSSQPPASQPAQPPPGTDIWLARLTAKGLEQPINITNRPGYDNQPSFTPDGKGILFTRSDGTQTDIYLYDFTSRASEPTRVTNTPESEYSPTVTPDGAGISVIRVEADGTQRLWRFTRDGQSPTLVLRDLKPVGYHAWGRDGQLALFVLGAPAPEGRPANPSTLQVADARTGRARVVAQRIGRSIHRVPGRDTISVFHIEGDVRTIKELDLKTRTLTPIVRAPESSEGDYTWTPDGAILLSDGKTLMRAQAGEWSPLADLAALGLAGASRMAVSPDGRWLALVIPDAPGPQTKD